MKTTLDIQKISIKKLNKIYIPKKDVVYTIVDNNIKLQLQMEAMNLGFIFTEEAVIALTQNIKNIYTNIFNILEELIGANKVWKPFYSKFPNEVFEKSDIELYFNAIKHYYSSGTWRLDETSKISNKMPVFEKVNFKLIGLANEEDINNLFKSILSSNGSITEFDKEVISFAVSYDKEWMKDLTIPFKETLCYFVGLLFDNDIVLEKYSVIKTATDVLRIAIHFSGGDISLAKKTIFKLKNKQRKFIVRLLEDIIREEEVAKHKNDWVYLLHHLHIGSYKSATKSNIVAKKLREEKIRTANSKVEMALINNDIKSLVELLPKNMGDFGRRLDHILRKFDDNKLKTLFINAFFEDVNKIDTRVLIQMLSHFKFRNEAECRIVIPKGVTKNATMLNVIGKLPNTVINKMVSGLEKELKLRFKTKSDLGKVYISEDLKKAPIPLQMRTASDGLFVMQRGTKLSLDANKSILRFFIHWIGSDVDLSACFLKEDLGYHSAVSYYSLRHTNSNPYGGVNSCHSGDITYAPAPNGACEFIDIDLDSITDKSIRYVAMDVRVYGGVDFPEQETNAGWMMRDKLASQSDKIFDAKTVEQRIALSAKKQCVVALFDVVNREVIWLDMEGQSSTFIGGNNVESNKASISDIAKMAVNFKNISLYDLLKLHAEERGTIVSDEAEADTIYDKNWIFRYTDVLSEYI